MNNLSLRYLQSIFYFFIYKNILSKLSHYHLYLDVKV